jgi:hypothetical protein
MRTARKDGPFFVLFGILLENASRDAYYLCSREKSGYLSSRKSPPVAEDDTTPRFFPLTIPPKKHRSRK